MKTFLDKLRQKSDAEKTIIAFVSALVLTFVIATSWMTWNFSKEEKEQKIVEKKTKVTPISSLSSQAAEIGDMFGELKNQFEESKNILEEVKNSTTTSEIESSVQ